MAGTDQSPIANEQRRPLSPHLQVYRFALTMAMSIMHRITGVGLYLGTLLLAWWLIAAATNVSAFETVSWFMGTIVGQLILLGFTWALFHHMLGGVRHFIWDACCWMEHPEREYLTWASLIGGLVLTILVWIAAYMMR